MARHADFRFMKQIQTVYFFDSWKYSTGNTKLRFHTGWDSL